MTHHDAIPLADILKESLQQEKSAAITVDGWSMSPLLIPGDSISLVPVDREQIQPGQIITFRDPDLDQALMTHRVFAAGVEEHPQQIVTRGDRTPQFDEPLEVPDILGLVAGMNRDGRALRLDQGAGLWLSARLAELSEIERRQISGVSISAEQLTLREMESANVRIMQQQFSTKARLVRAIVRLGSKSLSSIVFLFSSRQQQPEPPAGRVE